MDIESATEELMSAVQRRAMEILALPVSKREARYKIIREAFAASARQIGERDPDEVGAKIEESTRQLVRIMETSGGATSGNA